MTRTSSIAKLVSSVAAHAAQTGGIDDLIIMCHGGMSTMNLADRECGPGHHGGWGLELCREWLSLWNVRLVTPWRGRIGRIIVHACGATGTGPGNRNKEADGARFMGELALWSRAQVVAGRDVQYYNYTCSRNQIEFGAWEEPVYGFSPGDGARRHVGGAPEWHKPIRLPTDRH